MKRRGHSLIVVNAIATYSRSVIAMVLVIFSSRWVLQELGKDDFGLFSLVGSMIYFISFINNIMAESTSRFYAYSIGENSSVEMRRWFNSSFFLHLCLAIVLVSIGWPVGEYVIRHYLTIAPDRLDAGLWVFRISMISTFANIVAVPFLGMFTAKQRIFETALLTLFRSLLVFFWAYSFNNLSGDKLIVYALGMSAIQIGFQTAIVVRASMEFPVCRPLPSEWFNFRKIRQLTSFGFYKLYGETGGTVRDLGSAILLNIYYGTGINTAYGIAMQVSTAANQLSTSMVGAFSPEINTTEGRGERQRMLWLSQKVNKFGTILSLFFALPLLIEMNSILRIWLGNPPPMTTVFCRLILVAFLCERLSIGYILAVCARGKIAAYQISLGSILVLALPLAWLILELGFSPAAAIGIAFIGSMIVCSVGRALWAGILLKIQMREWLVETVLPSLLFTLVSVVSGLIVHFAMPESFTRLVLVTATTIVVSIAIYWIAISDDSERNYIRSILSKITQRNKG